MNYVAIYRALSTPPTEPITVARGDDYAVHLHPGPLAVSYSTGWADPWSPTNSLVLGLEPECRKFPAGSYVIVVTTKPSANVSGGSAWSAAKDRIAQLVAVLDLDFAGVAQEKVYEGPMLTPSTPMHLTWEEGFRFSPSKSHAPADIAAGLQTRADHVLALSGQDAARFALAARWFQRANDSTNSIDRVLFYYTVLEVFPAAGTSDVPGAVARFLAERVYAGATPADVKARLNLGRICGFRGEIVHDGKASVAPDERATVDEHVKRLQAIARTCLRVLAGLAPGSELDRFMMATAQ
jgi:hypothetical protein